MQYGDIEFLVAQGGIRVVEVFSDNSVKWANMALSAVLASIIRTRALSAAEIGAAVSRSMKSANACSVISGRDISVVSLKSKLSQ